MDLKMMMLFLFLLVILIVNLIKYNNRNKGFSVPTSISNKYKKSKISTSKIKIRSNRYFEDIEESVFLDVKMSEGMFGSNDTSRRQMKVICILVYEKPYRSGIRKLVSPPINLQEDTLRNILTEVKEIEVYIDPDNEENYYFDLSFLKY